MEPSHWQVANSSSRLRVDMSHKQQATFDPNYLQAPAQARAAAAEAGRAQRAAASDRALEVDWAGNPVHVKQRAGVDTAAARAHLSVTEQGLLPSPEAGVQREFVGKKHYEGDIRFSSHASEGSGAPMGSAAYQVGPGAPSAADWTSTAKVMQSGDKDTAISGAHTERRLRQQSAAAAANAAINMPGYGVQGALTGRYPSRGSAGAALTAAPPSHSTSMSGRRGLRKDMLGDITAAVADSVGSAPRAVGTAQARDTAAAREAAILGAN